MSGWFNATKVHLKRSANKQQSNYQTLRTVHLSKSILATLLVTGVIVVGGEKAQAESSLFQVGISNTGLEQTLQEIKPEKTEDKSPPQKKQKVHTVVSGDTLGSISKKYKVDWKRIYFKNKKVKHPDQIGVGMKLVIPRANERLKKRDLNGYTGNPAPLNQTGRTSSGGGSVGRFEWGWCTWYAASQRPDLNVTGNAAEWIVYANGTTPKIGAVAVNTTAAGGLGHVAIVIAVKGSQVKVRHMNYQGFGVVSEDWTDKSYWSGYIY